LDEFKQKGRAMGAAFRFIQRQLSTARTPWKIALSGGT
jgi:hypothetical protein